MISYALYCQIRSLHQEQKLSSRQIATQLQITPKTVRRWLKEEYRQAKRPQRASKLDPFKPQIKRWLQEHDLTAQQVLQRLNQQGFQVGYSVVLEYVRLVRPKHTKAFLTLNFLPGECLQVDWGSWGFIQVGATRRRLSFFAGVLCHSRLLYVEFTLGQSQEHFLSCHANAFAFFKGVPQSVMVDNCKTAILSHPLGQPAQINPRYLDFANHYGFAIRACGAGQPQEKGRVENAVGYVKKNYLRGLELPPWPALNPGVMHWLETIANVRMHGETHQTPLERFQEEKLKLKPITALPYDTALVRSIPVNTRFRVLIDTNRYSVPSHLAGSTLTAKLYPHRLCLYHQDTPVAEHIRSYERHLDFELPDHAKPLLEQRLKARSQHNLHRFLSLCPIAPHYYEQLQQRRFNGRHHIQKILALVEIYGADSVVRALQDTHDAHAYSCEYVANLLEQRRRPLPIAGALHLTRASDLLDLDLPEPDLSLYERSSENRPPSNPS